MEGAQELVQLNKGNEEQPRSNNENNNPENSVPNLNNKFHLPKLKHYKWWCRVMMYILFLLIGQTTATLLGRLYFDKGGNSKWMATLVQSAGFPILIPPLLIFAVKTRRSPQLASALGIGWLTLLYFVAGVLVMGDNLMYSYGLLYLPVSTYSLLCATQLGFNAISSFFINSQKFTILVLNSVVLLTISACLLAINADNEGPMSKVSRGKYIIGFLCTIGASAMYSLLLSMAQFCFEKVIKNESFITVLSMQFFPSLVATCVSVVGLFASGEWRSIHGEMDKYKMGRVSYVMTLAWTAITWQISSIGLLGLIFEVSSLFGNVISTLGLPLVPVFAVVLFHDKMNGVKVVSLVLAVWGFMSYIYQHYLDDSKDSKTIKPRNDDQVASTPIDVC